jgi:hypothetical protein
MRNLIRIRRRNVVFDVQFAKFIYLSGVTGFAKGKQRIRVGNQGEHPEGSFFCF